MKTTIHLLLVEDTEDDSLLILDALQRGGYKVESQRVETEAAMRSALRDRAWDLIITDYCMPEFDAPGAIAVQQEVAPETPLIVVSGTVGEDVAVETLKLGADDYLLKQSLTRLVPAVDRALQMAEGRRQRRALEYMKNLFMDKLLDIVCIIDAGGRFCEISAAAEGILGYTKEELTGRAFLDFVHPDDRAFTKSEAVEIMEGRPTKDFENRYLHKSGKTIHLMWSAVWSQDDQLMIAVARDVTDRKKSAEELRLRERALGEVSQGVLISDENRLIIYVNESFTAITGYQKDEMLGRNCSILQGPDTDPATVREMRAALQAGQAFDCEILNYRKDETPFWNDLSIAPLAGEVGAPIRFIGIQRDVTERKRGEETLRQKTALFEALVENSPDGIWVVDREGDTILQNQRVSDLWEIPRHLSESKDGVPIREFIIRQTTSPLPFAEKLDYFLSHPEEIGRGEVELLNGRILDWYSAAIHDKAGICYGRIRSFRDVTKERQREKKLALSLAQEKELTEKARAGERAKSEFLAVMSHEVRTPLNGILGFAELLAQTPELSAEGRSYSQTIVQSGEALLHVLDDILDFSRLEAGRLQIQSAPFDPRKLLQDIHNLLARQAAEKDLDFTFSVAPTIPVILEGDVGRLRQVLLNLAGNAIKFTDSGSVTMCADPEDGVASRFVFSVSDTGVGISPGQIEQIFEPFTQGDSSISRRYGGTGLGLTISRRLTELLGGDLAVCSEPGRGSRFFFTVPFGVITNPLSDSVASPAEPLDADFATRHPLRILLVEDDRVNLKLLQTLIRRLGYAPLTAADGVEAVEVYRRERPDFLLMDLQMPEMDGIEATAKIRELEKVSNAPSPAFISALTANIFPADRQRCFDTGMDDYLNKPVKISALAQMIAKVSRLKSTARDEPERARS